MFGKLLIMMVGIFLLSGLISSCTNVKENTSNTVKTEIQGSETDKQFEALAKNFIDELLVLNPEWATSLGEHKYDGKLSDYTIGGVDKNREFAKKYLAELEKIPLDKLSKANNVDYRIWKHNLESNIFQIETLKEYEWNPMSYNVGGAINDLLQRDFAPLKDRLGNAKLRLEAIPQVIEAAKANLKNPPKVHTETAIQQNDGVISLIKGDLQSFVNQANLKDDFAQVQEKAIAALEDYGKWLKEDLLPRSDGDFRIGSEKYQKKLKYSLESDLTKEEILKRAEEDLKATQNRMYEVALPLFKKYFPDAQDEEKLKDKKTVIKAVLDKLAEERPDNETIVALAEKNVAETTKFVSDKKLVTVPGEPLKVIEMPEFARGTAVAYFDSAGPFEEKNETFYAIAPTPKDWSNERRESFYKEYNNYMVQDLTVHEAMPGHYLQIMHSNDFKAPTTIRAIFRSGTFTEGWAVYSEQLMAEKGYGGAEVEMQQLKMKLRVIINAIIDQKIHTAGMTEKEAVDFMMNEGFQEEGEAVGKWKRANLTSTQLSTYYVGSIEVNDIRKAYEEKNKDNVDMLKMHDAMLSFGSPAPKYVKEMLDLK
ncbi:MAG: DUF885 domain-containing protein [Aridibacter sp.]|nr:DUF885 domain-containing protein [Acidobacteriota bacterium]